MTVLVRVVAPHFVAGLIFDASTGKVIEAANILGWTLGKSGAELAGYFDRKGWTAKRVAP